MSHMIAGLTNRTRVHLRYAGCTLFPDISSFSNPVWDPLLLSLHICLAAMHVEASQIRMVSHLSLRHAPVYKNCYT